MDNSTTFNFLRDIIKLCGNDTNDSFLLVFTLSPLSRRCSQAIVRKNINAPLIEIIALFMAQGVHCLTFFDNQHSIFLHKLDYLKSYAYLHLLL